MGCEAGTSEGRKERWSIPVLAFNTFLFTFISAFLLLNPSVLRGPEVVTEDDVGTVEEGYCRITVDAPGPFLRCGSPVKLFEKLRQGVIANAGFDFLAKCGDVKRHEKARFSTRGVANDSRHKVGLAFDYNQEDARVLIVREDVGGLTYWRTYLRCEMQDGTCGVKAEIDTDNAGRVSAYLFDFTSAAESYGWERIPAQEGWESSWKRKEFWHYQLRSSVIEGTEAVAAAKQDRNREGKSSPLAIRLQSLRKMFGF